MNFLLRGFLSHLVTSSRSSPAFFLSTFVSVAISLCTFTGLELSVHTYSKEKVVFYSEWLNAVKSPLVKVSWSEDFYSMLTEYSCFISYHHHNYSAHHIEYAFYSLHAFPDTYFLYMLNYMNYDIVEFKSHSCFEK